jgi:hypothetical protein
MQYTSLSALLQRGQLLCELKLGGDICTSPSISFTLSLIRSSWPSESVAIARFESRLIEI